MAATFTHQDLGSDPALVITDAMIAIDHELTHVPVKSAMQMIDFCRNRLAATEARLLADRYEKGASDRDVENLAASASTGTSTREAKKRASRAKATNANPTLAEKLDTGELTSEQVDVVAEAAAETDGAAACDSDLIDSIAGTSPEQGRKKAKKFVNDRRSADEVQTRHDRQFRRRGWYKHRLPNGNAAITFHGTDESIDAMARKVTTGAEAEYQADGGRDVPRNKHPRTNDQRGFDSAARIFTGADAEHAAKPGTSQRKGQRDVMHINITLDQVTGADLSPILSSDGRPLPASFVEEIACGCDIIGHIFSATGELLWQTRKQRLATTAQINGLIARDGGCVQCGDHHSRCVAHHLLPWHAPAQGETNIDNLALLCTECHTRIHQRQLTLYYDAKTKTWKTRRARPDEIPPDGVGHQRAKRQGNKRQAAKPETTKPRLDEQRTIKRLGLF